MYWIKYEDKIQNSGHSGGEQKSMTLTSPLDPSWILCTNILSNRKPDGFLRNMCSLTFSGKKKKRIKSSA